MAPPLNSWPYSDAGLKPSQDNKCVIVNVVDNLRNLGLNFTFIFIFLQVIISLSAVSAGPVILSLDYLRGPQVTARNIRNLPCISRTTGQEGLCMFAIDCLKANGTHLGTCIDRFYFGSCCQIPDKFTIPHIVANNIEDNSIDSANFVHPLTEDKIHSAINKITDNISKDNTEVPIVDVKPLEKDGVPTNKPDTVKDISDPDQMETKSDELTTLDHVVNDDIKTTNAIYTAIKETTTQSIKVSRIPEATELPFKLSTFQSVSGEINNTVTEKPESKPSISETIEEPSVKPTRKPIKPSYKPRPPYRPANFTRPSIIPKPRPTKPIIPFNTTRKPPYRQPPKRPSTKKPLPSPPRLNITIIPQPTSPRPVFTRPIVGTITYISSTGSKVEERPVTTTTSTTTTTTTTPITTTTTTTPLPTTTTTSIPSTITTSTTTTVTPTTTSTTTTTTEIVPLTTEPVTEIDNIVPETLLNSDVPTEKITEKPTEKVTERVTELEAGTTESTEAVTQNDVTTIENETFQDKETEKETPKPATEAEIPETTKPTSETEIPVTIKPVLEVEIPVSNKPATEMPPPVTSVEASSRSPETTTSADDWSPITPPEGWILISTISPKPETAKPQTTQNPTELPETTEPAKTTVSEVSSSSSTTTTTAAPSSEMEFVVNITMSPTAPPPTSSMGLNVTLNQTEATSANPIEDTTISNVTSPTESPTTTTTESYNMSNYKEVCGRRMWPQARIVGGAKSGFGQWPWQISLRQYRTSTYLHKCGAALLNENWAITAAHCVERVPPSELLVRLGEYDLANEEEPYGFAERRVQIVASHPHFDPATFEYDLALLRFYEPVTFQPNILPVCVPDDDDDYVGRTAYVTGWGRLYDEGPLPSVLQEVEVPVINNTACESMYLAAGYNEHIPNIFICAGWKKGGSDSCEGDSGGPMVVQRTKDNRFVLSGIISWGIGCAEPNQPGVYTRISEFRDWINQILQF